MTVSSGPRRIQRRRTRGWRMPEGVVYVGRPTKWGNPFRVEFGVTREDACRYFRDALLNPAMAGNDITNVAAIRAELRGKDLACWCRLDQACHADVLLEIANSEGAMA